MLTTCTRWIEFARYVKYVSICDSLQTPAQFAAKDWVHMRLLPCCGGGTPRFQSLLVPFHSSHDFPLFGLQNSFFMFSHGDYLHRSWFMHNFYQRKVFSVVSTYLLWSTSFQLVSVFLRSRLRFCLFCCLLTLFVDLSFCIAARCRSLFISCPFL